MYRTFLCSEEVERPIKCRRSKVYAWEPLGRRRWGAVWVSGASSVGPLRAPSLVPETFDYLPSPLKVRTRPFPPGLRLGSAPALGPPRAKPAGPRGPRNRRRMPGAVGRDGGRGRPGERGGASQTRPHLRSLGARCERVQRLGARVPPVPIVRGPRRGGNRESGVGGRSLIRRGSGGRRWRPGPGARRRAVSGRGFRKQHRRCSPC